MSWKSNTDILKRNGRRRRGVRKEVGKSEDGEMEGNDWRRRCREEWRGRGEEGLQYFYHPEWVGFIKVGYRQQQTTHMHMIISITGSSRFSTTKMEMCVCVCVFASSMVTDPPAKLLFPTWKYQVDPSSKWQRWKRKSPSEVCAEARLIVNSGQVGLSDSIDL